MGQQQLLLLVLATVIVGIATVVGIQAFSQNNVKSNADAMLNDAVRIASDAQAWAQKGSPFGGPESYADFTELTTLNQLGYQTDGPNGGYETLNGECVLENAASPVIRCTNATLNNEVTATIDNTVDNGLSDDAITGTVVRLGVAAATGGTGDGG